MPDAGRQTPHQVTSGPSPFGQNTHFHHPSCRSQPVARCKPPASLAADQRSLKRSRHSKSCGKQATAASNPAETLQETHKAATPTRSNPPFDQVKYPKTGEAAAPNRPRPDHCQAGLQRLVRHQGTKVGPREQTAAWTSKQPRMAGAAAPAKSKSFNRQATALLKHPDAAPGPMLSVRRYPFRAT